MSDIEQRIAAFLDAVDGALPILAARAGPSTSQLDIELALVDVKGVDEGPELLDHMWFTEEIIRALTSYDFARLHPEVLEEVELREDIVPDGVLRLLTEQRIRYRNHVWVIHKNDADPFPSNPHAHNYDTGHKLHLGTGELFIKRRCVGRIHPEHLKELRTKIRYQRLPNLEVH